MNDSLSLTQSTQIYFRGFALCAGLIVAIGAQNAFVLKQGLKRQHVFAVAALCAFFDALFISVGSYGMGALVAGSQLLMQGLLYFGVAFLFWYGLRAFRAAWNPQSLALGEDPSSPTQLLPILATAAAFTLLNPHVYIDTVVLVGGIASQVPLNHRWLFVCGGASASIVWFFGLGYGARWLAPLFKNPKAWRVLDFIIGCTMWGIAVSLLLH